MSNEISPDRQPSLRPVNERAARNKALSRRVVKDLYEKAPKSNFFLFHIGLRCFHFALTSLSQLAFGQYLLSFADVLLDTLEKSLDFCIADEVPPGNVAPAIGRKTLTSTGPPMNWILFIPFLIGLRLFCLYLSVINILLGRGEINVKHLKMKLLKFRLYFRSVRHFAVHKYSPEELIDKKYRCKQFIWRLIYHIYEAIIMTSSPIEKHLARTDDSVVTEEQTDAQNRQVKRGNVKKNSLNQIDNDRDASTDDDKESLTTQQMLDEYAALDMIKDTSMDPDYEPSDEPSSEEISSEGEASSEEERTESQKKLNGTENETLNGHASDSEQREKSKKMELDEQQMIELENQLVMKIMSHFKDTFNYSPNTRATEDVFYSPIGSPPEKAFNSDSGPNSISMSDDAIILQRLKAEAGNQISEITINNKTKDISADFTSADSP